MNPLTHAAPKADKQPPAAASPDPTSSTSSTVGLESCFAECTKTPDPDPIRPPIPPVDAE